MHISKKQTGLVYNTDKDIYVWDLEKGRRIAILSNPDPSAQYIFIIVSENREYVASFVTKKMVDYKLEKLFEIWSIKDKKIISQISANLVFGANTHICLAHMGFIANDNYLALMIDDNDDTYLYLYEIQNGLLEKRFLYNSKKGKLEFKTNEIIDLFSSHFTINRTNRLLSNLNLGVIKVPVAEHYIKNVYIFKNQKRMLCLHTYHMAHLYIVDPTNLNVISEISLTPQLLLGCCVSLCERYVAIEAQQAGNIKSILIYDLIGNKSVKNIPTDNSLFFMSFIDQGLYVGTDSEIKLIEFEELGINDELSPPILTFPQRGKG